MRIAFCLLVLSACSSFPQLDDRISDTARDAPYPTLTPVPIAPAVSGADEAALQARIDRLQARADRIRRIDITALQ